MRSSTTERCSMRRYENYASALAVLSSAQHQDLENEFVQSGVIDKFALQFELGRKLLKRLLSYEGEAIAATGSPRDIIKAASAHYEFMDEERWLCMLRDRSSTTHVYDGEAAKRLVEKIITSYIPEFENLDRGLSDRYGSMLHASDDSIR